MPAEPPPQDTVVTFVDDAGTEYPVALPRAGHTNAEVCIVAYRWACHQVAEGAWRPHGEIHYLRIGSLL